MSIGGGVRHSFNLNDKTITEGMMVEGPDNSILDDSRVRLSMMIIIFHYLVMINTHTQIEPSRVDHGPECSGQSGCVVSWQHNRTRQTLLLQS